MKRASTAASHYVDREVAIAQELARLCDTASDAACRVIEAF